LPITIPAFLIGWVLAQNSQPKQMGKIKKSHKCSSVKIQIISKPTIIAREKPEENQPIIA